MGRPSQPLLSRAAVVASALRLADELGPDGLTVAAIARDLDVRSQSIYHWFADRQAIVEAVTGQLLAEVEVPPDTMPPAEWAYALACGYRRVMLRHRRLVPLIGASSAETRSRSVPMLHAQLRREGVADADLPAFDAIFQYVVGSIVLPSPPPLPVRDEAGEDELFAVGWHTLYHGLMARYGGRASARPHQGRSATERPTGATVSPLSAARRAPRG